MTLDVEIDCLDTYESQSHSANELTDILTFKKTKYLSAGQRKIVIANS